jgi:hypothetical protein
MTTQTAYASSRYIAVPPGEAVEAGNGDGTNTHFVLDTLATEADFTIDAQWWQTVYGAVKQEVKRLAPAKYNERSEDIILLLHDRPMDYLKIASLRFRLTDGEVVKAGELSEAQALRLASHMFLEPEAEQDYIVKGWFFWAQSKEYDIMALDCRDSGETVIHELTHAFTVFDSTTEERERIAQRVVESLMDNEDFMALLSESSLTPRLDAPSLVALADLLESDATPPEMEIGL